MGWDSEYLHFTNADNPYGDNNLLDTFVWKKKLEKDGLTDLTRYVKTLILVAAIQVQYYTVQYRYMIFTA